MIRGRTVTLRVSLPLFMAIAAMAAMTAPGAARTAGSARLGAAAGINGIKLPSSAAAAGKAAAAATSLVLPEPGDTPAPSTDPQSGDIDGFYTGTDRRMYTFSTAGPIQSFSLGGQFIGGPGVTGVPPVQNASPGGFVVVFGQGADHGLWMRSGSAWVSLGGRLTSRPGPTAGALAVPGGESIDVVVRGADGAVWDRELVFSAGTFIPQPWRSLGGRVLAGAGPAAVNVGGTLFVLAIGTDQAVWVNTSTDGQHFAGWRSLGGRATSDMGAGAPADGVGVVWVRGADNAAWFKEFAGTTAGITAGWHTMHGRLTSGVGVDAPGGGPPQGTVIDEMVLGTDSFIWDNGGPWPLFGSWIRVFP